MNKIKALILTSLFSGLVFIFTTYFLHIPIGVNGGYIHFGDAFIYIAAIILPFPYSLFVGAIGAGFADFFSGGLLWLPATVIIKPLMALFFTSKYSNILKSKRNLAAPILSGLFGLALYYLYESLIFGSFVAAFYAVPLGLIQVVGSAVVYYAFIVFFKDRAINNVLK